MSEILRTSNIGKAILHSPKVLFERDAIKEFSELCANISETVALDLNAEVQELLDDGKLDYKASLKSATWCQKTARTLVASYQKDVRRKKAEPIEDLLSFME